MSVDKNIFFKNIYFLNSLLITIVTIIELKQRGLHQRYINVTTSTSWLNVNNEICNQLMHITNFWWLEKFQSSLFWVISEVLFVAAYGKTYLHIHREYIIDSSKSPRKEATEWSRVSLTETCNHLAFGNIRWLYVSLLSQHCWCLIATLSYSAMRTGY